MGLLSVFDLVADAVVVKAGAAGAGPPPKREVGVVLVVGAVAARLLSAMLATRVRCG